MLTKGPWRLGIEIFFIVLSAVFQVSGDLWVNAWTNDILQYSTSGFILVYGILNMITAGSIFLRNIIIRKGLIEKSEEVHDKMQTNVLKSNMNWFHLNPSSRIVYRFTNGQSIIDDELTDSIIASLELFIYLCASIFIFNALYCGFLVVITAFVLIYMYYAFSLFLWLSSSFYQIGRRNKTKFLNSYVDILNWSVQLRSMNKGNYLDKHFDQICGSFQDPAAPDDWLKYRHWYCAFILCT